MTPATMCGLLGAFLGFLAFLAPKILHVNSSLLVAILFPTKFLATSSGLGPFGHMIFDTGAYLGNVLLYAAVGYGIGWLFTSKRFTSKENEQ